MAATTRQHAWHMPGSCFACARSAYSSTCRGNQEHSTKQPTICCSCRKENNCRLNIAALSSAVAYQQHACTTARLVPLQSADHAGHTNDNQQASLLFNPSLAWLKLDADAVHTVALISGCWEALPLEHMAQVAAAVLACDLDTRHAKSAVLVTLNCVGQVVIERWPAATRVELGVRPAEACQDVPGNTSQSSANDLQAVRCNTAHALCDSR